MIFLLEVVRNKAKKKRQANFQLEESGIVARKNTKEGRKVFLLVPTTSLGIALHFII